MNCKQFRSYIPEFFKDRLNTYDTEAFLSHVSTCKECAEELEIMHLLQMGLLQLTSDAKEETYDFKGMLKDKLVLAEKTCRKVRRAKKLRAALVILVNITAVLGMAYQVFAMFGGKEWLANYF